MKKLLFLLLLPFFTSAQSWTYQKDLSSWSKAAKRNLTGAGVRIAVMGTGCNIIGTVGEGTYVVPTGGWDFVNDISDYSDYGNHDTPVVSQIAQSSIALAPDAEIYMLKVLTPTTTEAAMLAALAWVVANDIDVVNMSFGYNSTSFDSAVQALITDHDIVVFAASGNSFTIAETERPATLTGVIAVNAYPINEDPYQKNINAQAGGHGVNMAAAGRNTEGIYSNGTYGNCNGTSFSCSFATGMFALYLQKARRNGSNVTRVKVRDYMLKRCIKQSFTNYFGSGYPTL